MKKNIIKTMIILLAVLSINSLPVMAATRGISIKNTFSDSKIIKTLSDDKYDLNKDGYLSKKEINKIKKLKITTKRTLNLEGISKLNNLQELFIKGRRINTLEEVQKLKKTQ